MDQWLTENELSAMKTKSLYGEVGIWMFILGDMMVFSLLFCVFIYYRSLDVNGFLLSQAQLNIHYGALNTLILLTSSLFVVMAVESARVNRTDLIARFLLAAIICGTAFLVLKVLEYSEKIAQGHTLLSDDFFMFYFVLTGIHLLHLLVGMLVLIYLFLRSRQVTDEKDDGLLLLEGGACYWHMVDLLWIVLFPLLYLMK